MARHVQSCGTANNLFYEARAETSFVSFMKASSLTKLRVRDTAQTLVGIVSSIWSSVWHHVGTWKNSAYLCEVARSHWVLLLCLLSWSISAGSLISDCVRCMPHEIAGGSLIRKLLTNAFCQSSAAHGSLSGNSSWKVGADSISMKLTSLQEFAPQKFGASQGSGFAFGTEAHFSPTSVVISASAFISSKLLSMHSTCISRELTLSIYAVYLPGCIRKLWVY